MSKEEKSIEKVEDKKPVELNYNVEQACNILHIDQSNRKVYEKLYRLESKKIKEWENIFKK